MARAVCEMKALFLFVLWAALLPCAVIADEDTNIYREGEAVRVYGNKIGPLHNTFETYDLFRTPGCPPLSWTPRPPTLGQALVGDKLYELNISVQFPRNVQKGVICEFTPTEADVLRWRHMILSGYAYQLLVDGLPLWAVFGKVVNSQPHIFLHRAFYFGFRGERLVNLTLDTADLEELRVGKTYVFTYSVNFLPSSIEFENRIARFADKKLFEPRVRWFVIANSLLLTLFLAIVVTTILTRVIRTDYQRIESQMRNEGTDDFSDTTGWKQLYADIHRVPSCPTLLCAFLGTGAQLVLMFVLGIVGAALLSLWRRPSHATVTMVAVLYAFTGVVAGCVSSAQFLWYATLSPALSKKWMRCMEFTMLVFPFFLLSCGTITNVVAHIYGSRWALHIGGVGFFTLLLVAGFCPSVVAGTFLGRYAYRRYVVALRRRCDLPHVNQIPRLIPPPSSFFLSNKCLILQCGLLPFLATVCELSFVLSSLWLDKLYYLYALLLLTFVIFIVVTCCVSITATYILLNLENHQWSWMSFGFGASSGIYAYMYAVYFYLFHTTMSGFCTMAFYFIYSATLSAAIALVGGSVSFFVASLFVQKIYTFVKSD